MRRNYFNNIYNFTAVVLSVAILCALILRAIFYSLAPWIWDQNHSSPDLLFWVADYVKGGKGGGRDGLEIYALYVLMYLQVSMVLMGCVLVSEKYFDTTRTSFIRASLIVLALILFYFVGLEFPMAGSSWWDTPFGHKPTVEAYTKSTIIVVLVLAVAIYTHTRCSNSWMNWLVIILLICVCFIATDPISDNYVWIFFPALQMYYDVPISEIYFRYDIFLSAIALMWMKLGLDISSSQILIQGSFALYFFVIYLFGRRLFGNNVFAILFLVCLVLVRIYASPSDIAIDPQGSPLRIDLWLLLLVLGYKYGPNHWSIGLACGLMIIFHRTFGIIYTLAYLQLLAIIFTLSVFSIKERWCLVRVGLLLRTPAVSLVLLVGCLMISHVIFAAPDNNSYFRSLGLGFLKISVESVYWYYPVVCATVAGMLFYLRRTLPRRYFSTGIFLLLLSIGNSVYFFGRSHEWNLITISGPLLFAIFLGLDLFQRKLNMESAEGLKTNGVGRENINTIAATILVLSVACVYAPNFYNKLNRQFEKVVSGEIVQLDSLEPAKLHAQRVLTVVSDLTHGSNKVEYFDQYDGLEYFLYRLSERRSFSAVVPTSAWLFRSEFHKHVKMLLFEGFYVFLRGRWINEIPPDIKDSDSLLGLAKSANECPDNWNRWGEMRQTIPQEYLGGVNEKIFEQYVIDHGDLVSAFDVEKNDSPMSVWGRWHYTTHGQKEKRRLRSLVCAMSTERYLVLMMPDFLSKSEASSTTM